MVPGERVPLNGIRRPLAAFAVTAALVWWLAQREGMIYIIGVDDTAASLGGPLLPAVSAGVTVALVYALLAAASGRTIGWIAAAAVILLPSFTAVHRQSVQGPPLLAMTMFMLAVMVHAPRFSFAYGGVAALIAVFVSPAAVGLPAVAVGWTVLHARRRGRRPWRRAALALAPLAVVLIAVYWLGTDAWPEDVQVGWRGHLDGALGATGAVLGSQLAPGVGSDGLRWLIVADTALIVVALIAMAWRRHVAQMAPEQVPRRLYEALVVLLIGYAAGLLVRTLLVADGPNPTVPDVFPLVVLLACLTALSVALQWPGWSRMAKLAAVALTFGWAAARLVLS